MVRALLRNDMDDRAALKAGSYPSRFMACSISSLVLPTPTWKLMGMPSSCGLGVDRVPMWVGEIGQPVLVESCSPQDAAMS